MILAVDLGSSSFKAAVFDGRLRAHGRGTAELEYRFGEPGIVELPVDRVLNAFRNAVGRALADWDGARGKPDAVVLTSQAQTFCVVSAGGEARIPFLSWMDSRPPPGLVDLADFGLHTGVAECLPILLVSKLKYLQASRQEGFVRPGDAVAPLPTFLAWKMTGRSAIDVNLAAMTGLYSLVRNAWWRPALDLCGIDESNLPEVVPLGHVLGSTTRHATDLGLPAGVPVVLAGNDQTAGAWGAELDRTGAVLLTLGTAQVAYVCLPGLPAPAAGTMRGPYGRNLFYRLAADECGGTTIRHVLEAGPGWWTDEEDFMASAASAPPGCHGLVFEADPRTGGGTWGSAGTKGARSDHARAVLECLARRLRERIGRLDVDIRERPVFVAGGGTRSRPWVEILSVILEVDLVPVEVSPLEGAARIAFESAAI